MKFGDILKHYANNFYLKHEDIDVVTKFNRFKNLPLFKSFTSKHLESILNNELKVSEKNKYFKEQEVAYFYYGIASYKPNDHSDDILILVAFDFNLNQDIKHLKYYPSDSGYHENTSFEDKNHNGAEKLYSFPEFCRTYENYMTEFNLTTMNEIAAYMMIVFDSIENYISAKPFIKIETRQDKEVINNEMPYVISSEVNSDWFFHSNLELFNNSYLAENLNFLLHKKSPFADNRIFSIEIITEPFKFDVYELSIRSAIINSSNKKLNSLLPICSTLRQKTGIDIELGNALQIAEGNDINNYFTKKMCLNV